MIKNKLLVAGLISTSFFSAAIMSAEETTSAYQSAYQYLVEQRWPEAQVYFERFYQQWPDSEYSDDAGYWRCFAREREQGPGDEQFECYGEFLERWNNSEWRDEVRDRLTVMSAQLGGNRNYDQTYRIIREINSNQDFNFDFDSDALAMLDEAGRLRIMEQAKRSQQQAVRVRESAMVQLEDQIRRLRDSGAPEGTLLAVRESLEQVRRNLNNVQMRLRFNRSIDSELLAVLSALRDDPRAADLLIEKLLQTDDPEVKARIVLMLEEFDSPEVNELMLELAQDFANARVQRNAIVVLLDRNDESGATKNLLRDIVTSNDSSAEVRALVISELDEWDEAEAVDLLENILSRESNERVAGAAARSLMRINSEDSRAVLMDSYEQIESANVRRQILEQINVREAPAMMSFLRDVALSEPEQTLKSLAVMRIATARNAISLNVLQDIYAQTDGPELQLAIISSLRSTRIPVTVEFLRELSSSGLNEEQLQAVVRTLDRLNMEETIPVLIDIYENSDEAILRAQTLRSLQQFDDYDAQTRDFLLRVLEDRLNSVETL